MKEAFDRLLAQYVCADKRMQTLPVYNQVLNVERVGTEEIDAGWITVLITPWCMNLILIPAVSSEPSNFQVGFKKLISFPSGQYEFIQNELDGYGGFWSCSLFSPMDIFVDQAGAVETAEQVMLQLFKADNLALTDRQQALKEQKQAAEADSASEYVKSASENIKQAPEKLSRRGFLTAGFRE